MKKSALYKLVEEIVLDKWRAEAINSVPEKIKEREQKALLSLEKALKNTEKGCGLINDYRECIENRKDYISRYLDEKLLRIGVELGQTLLQKPKDEND